MIQHNWHNLAHYGLRGHAQHAKELRQRRLMVRMGWLMALGLLLVSVAEYVHAGNEPAVYELVLAIYPASEGHHNDFRSYRDVLHVPAFDASDADSCNASGDATQQKFDNRTDRSTMSRDMLDYVCLRTK